MFFIEETLYCPCPWNKKQKCACCKPGWCLCSVSKNPDMCGPCKSPCVCYSEIPGTKSIAYFGQVNLLLCLMFEVLVLPENKKNPHINCLLYRVQTSFNTVLWWYSH